MRQSITNVRLRKGAALLLVLFIAFGSILAMLGLFGLMAPRQFAVKGEAVSERALSMADAGVDRIVELINLTGMSFNTPVIVEEGSDPPTEQVTKMIIAQLLAGINGGTYDAATFDDAQFNSISEAVRRYFYNISTNEYYRLKSGDVATGTIENLSMDTETIGGLAALDASYLTDNLWFEMDTNASYHYVVGTNPDTWELRVTSYNLATPSVKRTIKAQVNRGDITVTPETHQTTTEEATGNWYELVTTDTTVEHTFSDFAGLYHSKVYFGKFEVTQGMIRSDSDLYMGGWAKDPVYAHGTVTDIAIDDGNRHDGRFGVNANDPTQPGGNLAWAKSQDPKYATDGYPVAAWGNGTLALTGTSPVRNVLDPNGGMQDVAGDAYYFSGNVTIEFGVNTSVTPNVGQVRFNSGSWLPMPGNGIIYAGGNATVSGTVLGRATVGAGNDILIGGDVVYSQPPRTVENTAVVGMPDSLGLVAKRNIVIPTSTYNADRTLQIDAAMMAVTGWFGIDSTASYHNINTTPHFVGIWNGAQAVWSGGNAPAIVSGSSVKGYEVQHTLFDYNLFDYGPPPMYPVSDTYAETRTVTSFRLVADDALQTHLHSLHKSDLTPINSSDDDYDATYACYKYYYGGKWYYYGPNFNVQTVYQSSAQAAYDGQSVPLYRVSWKEQIAQPVVP
jgi:hypothetical protein